MGQRAGIPKDIKSVIFLAFYEELSNVAENLGKKFKHWVIHYLFLWSYLLKNKNPFVYGFCKSSTSFPDKSFGFNR